MTVIKGGERIMPGLLKYYTQKVLSKIQPRKVLEQKLHRTRKTRRDL